MVKIWRYFLVFTILLIFFNNHLASMASNGEHSTESNDSKYQDSIHPFLLQNNINLLSSSDNGISFKIQTPQQEIKFENVTEGNASYVSISIPGWFSNLQSGKPAIPYLSQQLGVPFGVELSLVVTKGPAHTIALPQQVLPSATHILNDDSLVKETGIASQPTLNSVVQKDPEVYDNQVVYPGDLARVSDDVVIRQQRVVSIDIFPIQYNPAKDEITIYESLTIEVHFRGTPPPDQSKLLTESPFYENIFKQQLLNYHSSRQWRQPSASLSNIPAANVNLLENNVAENTLWTPPNPGWRIKVREEGFYKLTYNELIVAGLPVDDLDPRTFQIYASGAEVAIDVVGEADGIFDSDDFLIFYGQSINNKYTNDNIYWLTFGHQVGLRISSRDGTPGSTSIPDSYLASKHLEQNLMYTSRPPGDENLERFFWDNIFAPSKPEWSHTFSLPSVSNGEAILTVSLLGYLSTSTNPDHHVRIYLNDIFVKDVWWDGITWLVNEINLPSDLLLAGNNTIRIECPNDTGVGYDVVYVDWIDLDYPNTFTASDNLLSFEYDQPGDWNFLIDNFSSDQISVYDISNPASVVKINGAEISQTENGYSAQFQDDVSSPIAYWVANNTTQKTVLSIEADTASNLQASTNAADYIIITHQEFSQPADDLRDYRASRGLRTISVDVQDIYDEFHYGIESAKAINYFLTYAYENWVAPAPAFVVLMGDGHYDPKNYLGYGRVSYIPPYLAPVDPWIVETASDNRYVTIAGADTFPDMIIGRISVNSYSEATAAVSKIIAYEQNQIFEDWQHQILAVADNADSAGNFARVSDDLLSCCLPDPYQPSRVYLGVTHATKDLARAAIQTEINTGKLIVNYIGHAAYTAWASEGLLTTTDIPLLQNGLMQPIVLAMTCYDGYFHSPNPYTSNRESLGEVFTREQNNGAIASWSPTGLGVATGHDYLNRGFFNAVFTDGATTVGEATLSGKFNLWSAGVSPDLLDTYILFGDPALVIANAYKAVDDFYQTDEDVILNVSAPGVLANDRGSDPLTAVWVSDPSNGSLSLNADGSFQYTPNTNFYGVDSFTYKLWDGVQYSNTATVSITVNAVNDAPVAVDDAFEIDQDTQLIVAASALAANDTDVDNAVLTVTAVSNPTNGTVNLVSGTITFTPTSGFSGTAGFDYTVSDGSLSDTGHVIVTVNASTANQPPVVSDIPNQTIAEGSTFTSINLDNFVSDVDNTDSQMTWSYSGNSDLSVTIIDRVATIGVPNTNWNGSETITFRATDPGGLYDDDAATFTVTAVNDPPVVSDIQDQTISEGSAFTTIQLDNFVSDVDNMDEEMAWSYSGNTALSVSIVDRVAIISIPTINWNGSETITFRATDPDGLYEQDAAILTVTAVNDAPVNSIPGSQFILIEETLVFEDTDLISISDVDAAETPGATLQVSLSVNHGVLSLSRLTGLVFTNGDGTADASMTFVGSLSDINAALDGMIYLPAMDYSGGDLLVITSNDLGYTGEGNALSDTDSVSILISEFYNLFIPMLVK